MLTSTRPLAACKRLTRQALVLVLCSVVAGCALRDAVLKTSPRDSYASMLRRTGLAKQALGVDWLRAGESALRAPVTAAAPFSETGYFPADAPMAVGYRMELQRGRVLLIEVDVAAENAVQIFVELYERREAGDPRRVAALAPAERSLRYEVERDGVYILRLQPELLRSGRFTLTQRTLASLPFPVQGMNVRQIESLFGAERDAGARRHEGVDIFAAGGTPALAVSAGSANTGTNNLGGNVVWLRDARTGRRYYYAHLDRWAFDGATSVQPGDVVGYIGNTGNARTTSPHLHFGVYDDGAVNPLPFLRPDDAEPNRDARGTPYLGQRVRLVGPSSLQPGPAGGSGGTVLPRHTVLEAVAASGGLVRVRADELHGYLGAAQVTAADRPVQRVRMTGTSVLRDAPRATAAEIDALPRDAAVEVFGRFEAFTLVRTGEGLLGWIESAVLP